MIYFFSGSSLHGLAYFIQAGSCGLSLVECLGTDLASVIDAHQSRYMFPITVVQVNIIHLVCRRQAVCVAGAGYNCSQCLVKLNKTLVDEVHGAGIFH
jgi:hypothetical protein